MVWPAQGSAPPADDAVRMAAFPSTQRAAKDVVEVEASDWLGRFEIWHVSTSGNHTRNNARKKVFITHF
jgi:hypothetical protein